MNDNDLDPDLADDPEARAIWRDASPETRAALLKLSQKIDLEFDTLIAMVKRAARRIRTGKAHDDA